MKFTCVRTCGIYRKGHEYELERPLPVLAMSAIRAGHLVAAGGGWCAPSEAVYNVVGEAGPELIVPTIAVKRGGIRFEDPVPVRPKKATKPRKKVVADTLESLAEQTAAGLDGLRGPTSV